MNPLDNYSLPELKLVYRLLHAQVQAHPDLMDSALLTDLQTLLQARARADGIDVSLHDQWANWLSEGSVLPNG
ncbi:MAG: hypothetical protein AMJ69_09885 [Gammaproteobacteria bacterium SG8_47]|nr:MAG: hypothetical protein AMJ69_09885 [Gammaproteobacteria bacterium SG8_47]